MTGMGEIIAAWDQPGRTAAIHPTRGISETAYEESGRVQADMLAGELPAGCRIVDFGCGDGRVTIPLAALGYHVTGADASPRMLAAHTERAPDIPTVQSDGADLHDQLGRKADAVVALAVLIHHTYTDGEQIITGLRAAVRANGLLILDWPTSDTPSEGGAWNRVTTWSREQQDTVCARIGLKRLDSALPWGVFKAVKASRS